MRELITTLLQALGLDSSSVAVPRTPAGCEAFAGRRIVMVDDSRDVLGVFIPLMTAATGGSARFIHHRNQSPEQLVEDVLSSTPEIALIDFFLAGNFVGSELVAMLLARQPGLFCIGFSSDPKKGVAFTAAGAQGFVYKNVDDPRASILDLASVIPERV